MALSAEDPFLLLLSSCKHKPDKLGLIVVCVTSTLLYLLDHAFLKEIVRLGNIEVCDWFFHVQMEFWICLLLTILGYIPGILYAVWVIVG